MNRRDRWIVALSTGNIGIMTGGISLSEHINKVSLYLFGLAILIMFGIAILVSQSSKVK